MEKVQKETANAWRETDPTVEELLGCRRERESSEKGVERVLSAWNALLVYIR